MSSIANVAPFISFKTISTTKCNGYRLYPNHFGSFTFVLVSIKINGKDSQTIPCSLNNADSS